VNKILPKNTKENTSNLFIIFQQIARLLNTVSNYIDKVAKIIVVISGIIMLISLSLGVFTRYVLKDPLIWTEEIARFCMLWLTFNGASIIMKKKELINFIFLFNMFPKKAREVLKIFFITCIMIFLFVFLYIGYEALIINAEAKASAPGIALFWPSLGLYIGAIFMFIHSVEMLFQELLEFLK